MEQAIQAEEGATGIRDPEKVSTKGAPKKGWSKGGLMLRKMVDQFFLARSEVVHCAVFVISQVITRRHVV